MVGALVMPALYFTLFFPGPAYLLLIRLTMGLIGVLLAGLRDVWALLVGFGGLPAVWLTVTLLQQASRMTWSCSNLRDDAGTARRSRGGVQGIVLFGLLLWIATRRLTEAGGAVVDR
jgi:hypothetical protein